MTSEELSEEREQDIENQLTRFLDTLRNGDFDHRQITRVLEDLRNNKYYDQEDVTIDDVEHFIGYDMLGYDRDTILSCLGIEEEVSVKGITFNVTTIDDQYKLETIQQLYKTYGTSAELERALGSELYNKIKHVVV